MLLKIKGWFKGLFKKKCPSCKNKNTIIVNYVNTDKYNLIGRKCKKCNNTWYS
jgi:phage FluMu protein Com